MIATQHLEELAHQVRAHALRQYDEGGWDVLYESVSVSTMVHNWEQDHLMYGEGIPQNLGEALATYEAVVSIWAEREADARNSAF